MDTISGLSSAVSLMTSWIVTDSLNCRNERLGIPVFISIFKSRLPIGEGRQEMGMIFLMKNNTPISLADHLQCAQKRWHGKTETPAMDRKQQSWLILYKTDHVIDDWFFFLLQRVWMFYSGFYFIFGGYGWRFATLQRTICSRTQQYRKKQVFHYHFPLIERYFSEALLIQLKLTILIYHVFVCSFTRCWLNDGK